MITLFTPQTAAANSSMFSNNKRTVRCVVASGISGSDVLQLQINIGTTSSPTWQSLGTAYQATLAAPLIKIDFEGEFRINKGVTAGNVGAYLSS